MEGFAVVELAVWKSVHLNIMKLAGFEWSLRAIGTLLGDVWNETLLGDVWNKVPCSHSFEKLELLVSGLVMG